MMQGNELDASNFQQTAQYARNFCITLLEANAHMLRRIFIKKKVQPTLTAEEEEEERILGDFLLVYCFPLLICMPGKVISMPKTLNYQASADEDRYLDLPSQEEGEDSVQQGPHATSQDTQEDEAPRTAAAGGYNTVHFSFDSSSGVGAEASSSRAPTVMGQVLDSQQVVALVVPRMRRQHSVDMIDHRVTKRPACDKHFHRTLTRIAAVGVLAKKHVFWEAEPCPHTAFIS
jgi:hypothetical protein